jgi:hypothetical protein
MIILLVFLNLNAKLRVPSNDARNIQMVIPMITRVLMCTEVPLYHFPKKVFQTVSNPGRMGGVTSSTLLQGV